MKKTTIYLTWILVVFSFLQCSRSENRAANEVLCEELVEEEPMPYNPSEHASNATLPSNLKLEKRANVTIDTKEPAVCRKYVDSLTNRYQAFIEEEEYFGNILHSFELTLRVPAASLDSFIAGLSGSNGKIVGKYITVTDRTTEYTDLSSRKKTQDEMLDRYRQMLKSAAKVSDMLEIQRRIDEIQIEADRAQGRLNGIDRNVNYSVLKIVIEDKSRLTAADEDDSFKLKDFGQAIVNGWHGCIAVIWFLFNIWPLLIITGLVVYWIIRRRAKNLK